MREGRPSSRFPLCRLRGNKRSRTGYGVNCIGMNEGAVGKRLLVVVEERWWWALRFHDPADGDRGGVHGGDVIGGGG